MSIYQRALASEFSRLHPEVQRRFSLNADDGIAIRCTGIMRQIWHGGLHVLPLLTLGAMRGVGFPAAGENIPFTTAGFAFRNELKRECIAVQRTFDSRKPMRSVAYSVYSERRRRIVDYLGKPAHLAVPIKVSVDANGGLHVRSGSLRLHEGRVKLKVPQSLTAITNVHEWYDDRDQRFYIDLRVENPLCGELFGYSGFYTVDYLAAAAMPDDLFPAGLPDSE